jgi:hypothetical protein
MVELNSEKTSLIPDVLFTWGCTEFCFDAGNTNLGILIQHNLQRLYSTFPLHNGIKKYTWLNHPVMIIFLRRKIVILF